MIPIFSNSLGKEELQAVNTVFKSRWLGFGAQGKLFEKEFAKKIGCENVLLVNSCSSALFLALKVLGIREGDEVIIPTINFVGTANAVLSVGAKPVFADVDTAYFNIIPEEISRLRTEKTKAVILLHYGGHACDMEKVFVYSKGLRIIEDSANSPFSKYCGKNCGSLGDIGCFSFDSMKILSMGEGGALCIKDKALFENIEEYRNFGLKQKRQTGFEAFKEKKEKWWEVELSCISGKYLSCDILAAIGRVQLKKVNAFIKKRKKVWKRYQTELAKLAWIEIPPEPLPGTESSYYLYWIKVKGGRRDALAKFLVENGVYCTFRYFPLHLVKKYSANCSLKNSEIVNESALNLPLHQNLSEKDQKKIINLIKKFWKNNF